MADATAAGALTDTVRGHRAPGTRQRTGGGGSYVWNCLVSQQPDVQACGTATCSSLRRRRRTELSPCRLRNVELSDCPASGRSDVWNCHMFQPPEVQPCGTKTCSSLRRLRRVELPLCLASGGSEVWNCHIFQLPEAQTCGTVALSSFRGLRSVELSQFPICLLYTSPSPRD